MPSVSSPRARCAAVICAGALDHGGHRLDRCIRDERHPRADAAPLEVDRQVGRPRGQVEERDRTADGHDADQDLERESAAPRRWP